MQMPFFVMVFSNDRQIIHLRGKYYALSVPDGNTILTNNTIRLRKKYMTMENIISTALKIT